MMKWYTLLTTAGHENKVRTDLMQRLQNAGKDRYVREMVVPTRQVTEIKDGKKVVKEQRFMPGYLLVNIELPMVHGDILSTRGVRGFLGSQEPVAMMQVEVDRLLGRGQNNGRTAADAPSFKVGETVKIISGPLSDFTGEISEVDEKAAKLTVMVPIFGRPTPTEVEWSHVRKDR